MTLKDIAPFAIAGIAVVYLLMRGNSGGTQYIPGPPEVNALAPAPADHTLDLAYAQERIANRANAVDIFKYYLGYDFAKQQLSAEQQFAQAQLAAQLQLAATANRRDNQNSALYVMASPHL